MVMQESTSTGRWQCVRTALQCDLLKIVLPGAYLQVANNTVVDISHAPFYTWMLTINTPIQLCCAYLCLCRFCFIFCGVCILFHVQWPEVVLTFWWQSCTLTAPCSVCALAQAPPTNIMICLVNDWHILSYKACSFSHHFLLCTSSYQQKGWFQKFPLANVFRLCLLM